LAGTTRRTSLPEVPRRRHRSRFQSGTNHGVGLYVIAVGWGGALPAGIAILFVAPLRASARWPRKNLAFQHQASFEEHVGRSGFHSLSKRRCGIPDRRCVTLTTPLGGVSLSACELSNYFAPLETQARQARPLALILWPHPSGAGENNHSAPPGECRHNH